MKIRTAEQNDQPAIHRLHFEAFGEDERELVANLAMELLGTQPIESRHSFVAIHDNQIVGCAIFSKIEVRGAKSQTPTKASILAPLAVSPAYQRSGIGSALIQHGLAVMKSNGMDLVFVYGDPKYYARFGFDPNHRVAAPFPLKYPEAWMAYEITLGALTSTSGVAACAPALSRPEYW